MSTNPRYLDTRFLNSSICSRPEVPNLTECKPNNEPQATEARKVSGHLCSRQTAGQYHAPKNGRNTTAEAAAGGTELRLIVPRTPRLLKYGCIPCRPAPTPPGGAMARCLGPSPGRICVRALKYIVGQMPRRSVAFRLPTGGSLEYSVDVTPPPTPSPTEPNNWLMQSQYLPSKSEGITMRTARCLLKLSDAWLRRTETP